MDSLINIKVLVVISRTEKVVPYSMYVESIPFIQPFFSDATTEVWEFGEENNKVISPSLPDYAYIYGIALVPVNSDFCRK